MRLKGKKVVLLAGPGYEDLELHYPRLRLLEEGAEVLVAGLGEAEYRGKVGYPVRADAEAAAELGEGRHALIIPGGGAPDQIRMHAGALALVRRMDAEGKPIGAICHAPHVLISAGIVDGRIVASYPAERAQAACDREVGLPARGAELARALVELLEGGDLSGASPRALWNLLWLAGDLTVHVDVYRAEALLGAVERLFARHLSRALDGP